MAGVSDLPSREDRAMSRRLQRRTRRLLAFVASAIATLIVSSTVRARTADASQAEVLQFVFDRREIFPEAMRWLWKDWPAQPLGL
jgi:hypothetical protein